MDVQLIALLVQIAIVIGAFLWVVIFRDRPRLREFWQGMARQWKVALVLTLIYLVSALIAFSPDLKPLNALVFILMSGSFLFSAAMLGLGFAARITGFEPLKSRQGFRALPGILLWVPLTVVLLVVVLSLAGYGLTSLGVTGPSDSTSALEFLEDKSLFQAFLILFSGAGIIEEIIFRLLIMTGLWLLFKRASLAILLSAAVFSLYHLIPPNELYLEYWNYPLYQSVLTLLGGLILAWIYQKRGLEAAILGHTLYDFFLVVIIRAVS